MEVLKEELRKIEKKGLLRILRLVEGKQSAKVKIDGKEVINFCSNNYLGLANDPRLKKAAQEALKKYGIGSVASRLVSGNMRLHQELEERIAEFKEVDRALLFNTGYTANCGIISALVGRGDIVFSDKLNHASIVDGIVLSRAEFRRYPHKDLNVLERLLKRPRRNYKKRLIVTDTIFSMDGDIAPLPEIVELAKKYEALFFVDEAHATGVFGKNGKGAVEHFGLEGKVDIQMGTLSKAVGTFGAFVCGSKILIDYLINKSRAFIYTTALPVSICAASIKALQIIETEPERRERLWENVEFFKEGLKNSDFNIMDSQSPIIPLLTRDVKLTMEFSQRLFDEGIFVQGIRPPAIPEGEARLRVTVTSGHKKSDLVYALKYCKKIGKRLGII